MAKYKPFGSGVIANKLSILKNRTNALETKIFAVG